jgi:cobaltochelatase CobS
MTSEIKFKLVSARELFAIDSELKVPVQIGSDFADHVPEIDPVYRFNKDVTLAILAGFMRDRRVMVQGLHGTGKSTHIEQVAARLRWPCVRVNLDGHISRLDLVGKDAVVLKDGKQITEFQEGIVPWALQRPVALIFDEYDAGRPDVMFVIQRILERDGKFTLMDQNRVIKPHSNFRLFATANTVGLGNLNGLYHGAQRLNHAPKWIAGIL